MVNHCQLFVSRSSTDKLRYLDAGKNPWFLGINSAYFTCLKYENIILIWYDSFQCSLSIQALVASTRGWRNFSNGPSGCEVGRYVIFEIRDSPSTVLYDIITYCCCSWKGANDGGCMDLEQMQIYGHLRQVVSWNIIMWLKLQLCPHLQPCLSNSTAETCFRQ